MIVNKPLLLINKHVLFKRANDILSLFTQDDKFCDFFKKQINQHEKTSEKIRKDINFFEPIERSDISFNITSMGNVRCHFEKVTQFEETLNNKNNSTIYNLSIRLVSNLGLDFSDLNISFKNTIKSQDKIKTYQEEASVWIFHYNKQEYFNMKILYDEFNHITHIELNDIAITNTHIISSESELKENALIKNFNTKFQRDYKTNDIKLLLIYGCLDKSYKDDIDLLNLRTDTDENFLSYFQPEMSKNIFEILS